MQFCISATLAAAIFLHSVKYLSYFHAIQGLEVDLQYENVSCGRFQTCVLPQFQSSDLVADRPHAELLC